MWIWQAAEWPNFEFDSRALQPAIAAARLAQGRMLGLASMLQLVDLSQLQISGITAEAVATAQIEGELLHPQSVRLSAARRLGLSLAVQTQAPASKPVRKNYKADHRAPPREEATLDLIDAAVSQWRRPLGQAQLFSWHAALFPAGYSGVTRLPVGALRSHADAMQIVTPRIGKADSVHYEAPPPEEVPGMVRQLIAWFNASQGQIDGLARAAVAHLWFEAIHPFEDGNGRIGRALSDLALAQDGQSSLRLFSLSHQLLAHRSDYYAQLENATGQARLDVTPWVQWFVQRVQGACEHSIGQMQAAFAKTRFWNAVHQALPALSASQHKVLNRLIDASALPEGFTGGLSTEKYVAMSGTSRATAYRELTALVAAGVLARTGQGRGTRYELAANMMAAPQHT